MGAATPPLIQEPFGTSAGGAYITNPVPVASQIGIKAGAASFTDGFPPLTMTPVGSGGVDFYGQDLNGILYAVTAYCAALTGGQFWPYNSAWSSANSGYAAGAILSMAAGNGLWLNTSAGNTANPDTSAASSSWVPLACYGATTINTTGGSTTLTAPQAATPTLIVTGTLASNSQIILPTWLYRWKVINNTTGAFTVTVKTSSGTGVICPQFGTSGYTEVYGDGTNINLQDMAAAGSFTVTLGGVSGTVTGTMGYEVNGRMATLYVPTTSTSIVGTSNANYLTASGIPSFLIPTLGLPIGNPSPCQVLNAAESYPALGNISSGSELAFLILNVASQPYYGTFFQTSNIKGIPNGFQMSYLLQ